MRSVLLAALGGLLLASAPAVAAGRAPVLDTAIDAPVERVWEALTTKQAIESWMVPVAEIDLRVGGALRTSYDKAAGLEGPNTIVHEFLMVRPGRLLVTRIKPAANAPFAQVLAETRGVWRLEPLPGNRTRLYIGSLGWQDGPEWDRSAEFFQKGNAWTIGKLKEFLGEG